MTAACDSRAAAPLQSIEQEPAWTKMEVAAATAWWLKRMKKTFVEARSPLMPFRCAAMPACIPADAAELGGQLRAVTS